MKLKKVIALCLASAMAVAMLASCGSAETKEESTAKPEKETTAKTESSAVKEEKEEPVTYTGMGLVYDEERQSYSNNRTWQKYVELTGLDIQVVTELPHAEAAEKANLIMNSGDYPDFIIKQCGLDLNSLGMDGVLIPLEDLIKENMPILTGWLDERDAWAEITAPDGHIYALPMITDGYFEGTGNANLFLNHKWMEKLGLNTPKSMEDLYNILKAFKEQDPNGNGEADEIPLLANGLGGLNELIIYQGGASYYMGKLLSVKDGELVFYPQDELYREWLEWITKFYQEGLLYENIATITWDEWLALGKSVEHDILGGNYTNRMFAFTHEPYWDDYSSMPTFDPDITARGKGMDRNAFSITDKCTDPATLLAAMDQWYDLETGYMCRYGLKGEAWDYDADGNLVVYPETEENKLAYKLTGAANFPSHALFAKKILGDNAANIREAEAFSEGHAFYGGIYLPSLVTTEEQAEELVTIKTDMNAYINIFVSEVVTGVKELNDTTWEEFKATLDEMGADRYYEIYNEVYQSVK